MHWIQYKIQSSRLVCSYKSTPRPQRKKTPSLQVVNLPFFHTDCCFQISACGQLTNLSKKSLERQKSSAFAVAVNIMWQRAAYLPSVPAWHSVSLADALVFGNFFPYTGKIPIRNRELLQLPMLEACRAGQGSRAVNMQKSKGTQSGKMTGANGVLKLLMN